MIVLTFAFFRLFYQIRFKVSALSDDYPLFRVLMESLFASNSMEVILVVISSVAPENSGL